MGIRKFHTNLGAINMSVLIPKRLAKLLNYDLGELKKDLVCAYNFTAEPPYLDRRTAENTQHLLSVILRYAEDRRTIEEVSAWTTYLDVDELIADAELVKFSADEFLRTERIENDLHGMSLS